MRDSHKDVSKMYYDLEIIVEVFSFESSNPCNELTK